MNIVIFDTSIGSGNLGDQIIMESVNAEIEALLPEAFAFRVPTHSQIGKYGQKLLKRADLVFAGGTNLLFSYWSRNRQWDLRFKDLAAAGRKVVLMGTGWTDYQSPPDWKARYAYNRLLSRTAMHSLRDSYSIAHLKSVGFDRVTNTGCSTLWELGTTQPRSDSGASDAVISTLTDYRPDPAADRAMLELLRQRYKRLFVWIQGSKDADYLQQLDVSGCEPINPSLRAFDAALSSPNVDYVGTRLHAGIRALQKGRRALILSVDNRAREMGRDFALPVIERGDMPALERHLQDWPPVNIKLPLEAIAAWRSQFKNSGEAVHR